MKLSLKIIAAMFLNAIVASVFAQTTDVHTTTETYTTTETRLTETVQTETVKSKASAPTSKGAKKVVIYVRNDSGNPVLGKQAKNLEYALSSQINNMGFGVINHDLVIRNANAYLQDPNSQYRTEAGKLKKALEDTDSLDMKLFEDASGLRLSEFIGADYILSLSISNLGTEKRKFTGYGVDTVNVIYNLRTNYNLYEAGGATGTAGGAIKATKSVRQVSNLEIESNDILYSLMEDTAVQMAALLDKQNKANQIIEKEESSGEIIIQYVIEALSFPELRKTEDGGTVLGTEVIPATITHVNAEIDGVARLIGGPIELSKGLHTFRIKQKDIEPIEQSIFVTGKKGQKISFHLSLTSDARARWRSDLAFVESIKDSAELRKERRMLTEAEIERLRGIAKMFEQSGFRFDIKELPATVIQNNKSLMGE